jgi:hypothetical protein
MSRVNSLLVVGGALIAVALFAPSGDSKDADARADLRVAQSLIESAQKRAAVADGVTARTRVQVAALERQRDLAIQDANAAAELLDALEVPDTCDFIFATAKDLQAGLTGALNAERSAHALTKISRDSLELALIDLRVATSRLSSAATAVASTSRPSFWQRLKPRPGAGGVVGIDMTGKPNAVVGLTLGWSF